ncbi:phage tail tape measure protein [Anaerosolibacter carboniphilus]|nr:hypothetical protein [Anaerosolibacter carboniphilus]
MEYAYKKMGKIQVVNNKGQITNQEKFNEALMRLMDEKFKGGMEKMASNTKGLWSTITGVTKSALANIIGATDEGTIKQGSAMDMLKGRIKAVADTLVRWQESGVFDKISVKLTKGINRIITGFVGIKSRIQAVIDFIHSQYGFIDFKAIFLTGFGAAIEMLKFLVKLIDGIAAHVKRNWGIYEPIIAGAIGLFIAFKAKALAVSAGIYAIGKAMQVFNFINKIVGMMNPWSLALMAIIAIGVLVWRNWDTIKAKALELYTNVTDTFTRIKETIVGAFTSVGSSIKDVINDMIDRLNGLIEGFNGLASFKAPGWLGGKTIGVKIPKIPKLAMGTPYFKGGLAQTDERGGEIKRYPSGTTIIPADKSEKIIDNASGGISLQIIIQGNVIGNEEYANYLANFIIRKIKAALGNR